MKEILINNITHIKGEVKQKLFDYVTKKGLFKKYVYTSDRVKLSYEKFLDKYYNTCEYMLSQDTTVYQRAYLQLCNGNDVIHTEYFSTDSMLESRIRIIKSMIHGDILSTK
jgi:hypothetical protein